MAIRAVPLPFDTPVPALSSSSGLRRAALWGLLVSKLLGGWGVQWDFALTLVAAVIGATVARRLSDSVTQRSSPAHGDRG